MLERAALEGRIVVSADSDFGMLLAERKSDKPSFILFKEPSLIRAADYAGMLLAALPRMEADLERGCVITFRRGRVRMRALPLFSTEG